MTLIKRDAPQSYVTLQKTIDERGRTLIWGVVASGTRTEHVFGFDTGSGIDWYSEKQK